jgi:hypothetical protein
VIVMAMLAQDAKASVATVTLAQTMRVLVVVLTFPPLLGWLAPHGEFGAFMATRQPVWWPGLLGMAAAGLAVAVSAPKAAGAATFNWAFTFSNGLPANVTVTANGLNPLTPGTPYSIQSITGTIGGFNIIPTTPIAYNGASNLIQISDPYNSTVPFWTNSDGFSFSTTESPISSWNIYSSVASGFAAADLYDTDSVSDPAGSGTIIVAGPPAPPAPPAPTSVPGPLPIFGACAAFGFSRRLRRRVLTSGLR